MHYQHTGAVFTQGFYRFLLIPTRHRPGFFHRAPPKVVYLKPKGALCFNWKFGLVLGGSPSKIGGSFGFQVVECLKLFQQPPSKNDFLFLLPIILPDMGRGVLTVQRWFVCSNLGPVSPAPGSNGGSGNPRTKWPTKNFCGWCFVIVFRSDPIIFHFYMYVTHANNMTHVPSPTPNIKQAVHKKEGILPTSPNHKF